MVSLGTWVKASTTTAAVSSWPSSNCFALRRCASSAWGNLGRSAAVFVLRTILVGSPLTCSAVSSAGGASGQQQAKLAVPSFLVYPAVPASWPGHAQVEVQPQSQSEDELRAIDELGSTVAAAQTMFTTNPSIFIAYGQGGIAWERCKYASISDRYSC